MRHVRLLITLFFVPALLSAQNKGTGTFAPKPLFEDPVYNGAADPVVVWNKEVKKWWMFYTNRKASDSTATGVTWVHGTRIGIAESIDGATWTYKDTARINYHPTTEYTYWAPEIVEDKGTYHMYLTYVPGVFADWNHPRTIVHLTSMDMLNWNYISTLKLASDRVIDACVYPLPDGTWRMWYNNELDYKSIYYADSPDLRNWTDQGKAISDLPGEGPVVFSWRGHTWMIVDNWNGLGVYSSVDLLNWKRQDKRLLELPGTGKDDQAIGGHADVIVHGDRAYLFYFTHPGRAKINPAPEISFEWRRSLIQVTELHYSEGAITCDRNEPVYMDLKSGK